MLILGALMAIMASFVSNLGLNLQKLSHLEAKYRKPLERRGRKPEGERTHMLLRPRWLTGLLMTIVGSIADFAALGFAAQSLVATLGSLTLVMNLIIAPPCCARS